MKKPADNTACTAHLVRLNFGFAETSYMMETLGDILSQKGVVS